MLEIPSQSRATLKMKEIENYSILVRIVLWKLLEVKKKVKKIIFQCGTTHRSKVHARSAEADSRGLS
jgi:hypothetical protein